MPLAIHADDPLVLAFVGLPCALFLVLAVIGAYIGRRRQ